MRCCGLGRRGLAEHLPAQIRNYIISSDLSIDSQLKNLSEARICHP